MRDLRGWMVVAFAAVVLSVAPVIAQSVADEAAAAANAAAAAAAADADRIPTISASVDTAATSVGGRIHLTLDVDIPPGWFVTPGEPTSEMGPFRARSLAEIERTEGHRQFVIALVAVEPGNVEVPPVVMRATQGQDADGIEIASPPVAVSVTSNLAAPPADPTAGPDMTDSGPGHVAPGNVDPGTADPGTADPDAVNPAVAEAEPAALKPAMEAPRDWRPVWIAALAALLAAVAGFFLLRWLRNRRRPPEVVVQAPRVPTRPAWEIAFEELDAIASAGWVEQGDFARQYDDVTETVRRYVENRYGVPALESTTDDLRYLLSKSPLPGPVASRVLSLLMEADLVKFAKGVPDPADARTTESRARSFVEETMPAPAVKEEAA